MVILRNLIKTSDNIIECDYYPEDRKTYGHVSINVETREIIEKDSKREENDEIDMYFNHAALKLLKIGETDAFKNNSFKSEYSVMWY
ncbi:hypothetical protein [uncultured Sharpea sp.]|uniref:hypothetical protein n=1 Tax=uncultured Sharpea sp. TaxID=1112738 RepID=UPI00258C7623|nr:hypothetical protein [uncultured Sharpea sp.]